MLIVQQQHQKKLKILAKIKIKSLCIECDYNLNSTFVQPFLFIL